MATVNGCDTGAPAQIAGFGMIVVGAVSALALAPWTWMGAEQVVLLGGWCALMAVGGWALACRSRRKGRRGEA
jgi:hypothetical protein